MNMAIAVSKMTLVGGCHSYTRPCPRVACLCLVVLIIYVVVMDIVLFCTIHNDNTSLLASSAHHTHTWTPFSDLSVKLCMSGPMEHYVHTALAEWFDYHTNFSSTFHLITANMVTSLHAMVSVAAGMMVSSTQLSKRRLGVGLFEVSMWLDALDGVIYRAHNHKGHKSLPNPGSFGYFFDGAADTLTVTALLLGIVFYLRSTLRQNNGMSNNNHAKLKELAAADSNESLMGWAAEEPTTSSHRCLLLPRAPSSCRQIFITIFWVSCTVILSSVVWNYSLAVYAKQLQVPVGSRETRVLQDAIFKSSSMSAIMYFWRLFNPHSLVEYILLAVFFDKIWELLCLIQYTSFVVYGTLITVTQLHTGYVDRTISQSALHEQSLATRNTSL